ncbi:hypothetical protein OPV22_007723 [Ensete ventricosum]|uniref:Auxin response factor n=1 Tax=Ensete ventricosum TaxID=4639 RepID=A0AAV8RP46_ENSVE|nr:hypothetical protein OPV22_007723 [Ensete ventricosum]
MTDETGSGSSLQTNRLREKYCLLPERSSCDSKASASYCNNLLLNCQTMRLTSPTLTNQLQEEEPRCLNSELWHACAGPLVSLPAFGSRVVYFPQGHSEQVAASTNKEIDSQIPNYPGLPPQLICQLHNVTMHADVETDEVYAQMTLQPLSAQEQKDPYLPADLVPRRAAEKVFPPLDFSQQPPARELVARDLHGNEWKFRHIFRGQPKRHLLTTGWSVFVSAKRLVAGDSVLFIWNENNQLLLAAHAAATNSRFTIFYNPRASPSEFVIPLAKYVKAAYHTRVSVGMRFRMLFETEDSSVRRYMGTITGISDFDPVRWPNSHWRSVKVGWDESTAGEKQPRRPWPTGLPFFHGGRDDEFSLNSPLIVEHLLRFINQAGSLYSSTGRMTFFLLAMIHGRSLSTVYRA